MRSHYSQQKMQGRELLFGLIFIAASISVKAQSQTTFVYVDDSKSISLDGSLFGYNTQLLRGPSWSDADFLNSVKSLQPQNLRYPGGTNANYWNWRTGWLIQGKQVRQEWKSLQPVTYGLSDLKTAVDATGASPVFVLNMLTSGIEEQLQMLKEAQRLLIPVKFIELGNEFYLDDPDYISAFKTGVDYALKCNEYIKAIKKEFKDVQIAFVGNSLRDAQLKDVKLSQRFKNWNNNVYANIKGADAVTFHVYGGSGLEMVYTKERKVKHNQRSQYTPEEQRVYESAFYNSSALQAILCVPYLRSQMFLKNDVTKVPQGIKVWVTEYNLFENEGIVAGTWAHGLYAASEALQLACSGKVSLICYHNIAHGAQFGAIFNTDNAFNGFLENKTTVKNSLSASGYSLQLVAEALNGKDKISPIYFNSTFQSKFGAGKTFPSVFGFIAGNNRRATLILLNLSEKKVSINLKTLAIQKNNYTQISGMPRFKVSSPSDLIISTGSISEIIELLPFSISKVE